MRNYYLWLAITSLFVLGITDSGRGPVYPDLLKDFQLSDTAGALFFFLTSFVGFLNNVAARFWLPRLGPYRALQSFLGIQITALVVLGLAPSFAWILAGAGVFGIALSGMGTVQNILVGQTSTPDQMRRAYAILHCMYGAASFVSPLLVSAVYRAGLKWQIVFFVLALFPAFLLLLSFLRPPLVTQAQDKQSEKAPLSKSETRFAIWSCALVVGYVFAELILSTRLALYMRRELGSSVEQANDVLAAFFGLMLIGRALFAFANWQISARKLLMASSAVSLALFVLGLLHHPYWFAPVGFAMAPFFPCLMSYVQEQFPKTKSETVFAWIFTAHAFGIMTMHALTGWFSDVIGLGKTLFFGPVALGFLVILLGIPILRSSHDGAP